MRLGVALLLPAPVSHEVDGLRRALGDRARRRIAAHLTLVPPVNVRDEQLPTVLSVLRLAATQTAPLALTIGPARSFLPANPTIYLGIEDGTPVEDLLALRDRVFVPPLERMLTWPFVPHVTIAETFDDRRVDAAVETLSSYRNDVVFDRIHLLRETRTHDQHRTWEPVADYPFRPRAVIGRGGLALELTVSHLADPEASAFERAEWADPVTHDIPPLAEPLVVVGRRDGRVVGVARGWMGAGIAECTSVIVGVAHRGQGIARHLRLSLGAEAEAG
jgi:2'-5' RNA ligase